MSHSDPHRQVPIHEDEKSAHEFLLMAAESLHRYGTPSYRLEGVMEKVAESLGLRSVFLYTPTALVVELASDRHQAAYVRRVDSGDVDIDRLLSVDSTLEALQAGQLTLPEATKQLKSIAQSPPVYNLPTSIFAASAACMGVAVIFGGSGIDTLAAGLFGCMIAYVCSVFHLFAPRGLLEPMLGFTVALSAIALGQWIPINDRLVTMAALILPIPGLAITIALTELTVRHLSSGSARLAGAMVTLFTLVVGVAIAWRMTNQWRIPIATEFQSLPWWCLWIAVALTPMALAVVFRAPVTQWPAIVAVVVAAFVASRIVSDYAGIEVGAFVGALVVGIGSNTYARWSNRPAMIPQTPGLLILVPGTIGYQSLTAMLEKETIRGVELAFSMSIIGVSLVGGLLLANRCISPRRML